MAKQFMQKNCIKSILLKKIKNCIIIEQVAIYLLMVHKIVASPLCLGNISKDFSVDNMKKSRIKWLCL